MFTIHVYPYLLTSAFRSVKIKYLLTVLLVVVLAVKGIKDLLLTDTINWKLSFCFHSARSTLGVPG